MFRIDATPQNRFDSLGSLDDAETPDLLSQDSGSTVSQTPPPPSQATPPQSVLPDVNEVEDAVRRRTQHAPASMPELKRADAVDHQIALEEAECDSTAAGSAGGATMGRADACQQTIVIPLRWKVISASLTAPDKAVWTSPWVSFAVPHSAVFSNAVGGAPADTHTFNTGVSSSSGFDSIAQARRAQLPGSARLSIGRPLFLECLLAAVGTADRAGDVDGDLVKEAAAAVSRVHCAVHLHFSKNARKSSAPTGDSACAPTLQPQCHSFDVFALSPATSLNGVPLHPHHRYHFHTSDTACCPDGVLALRLGPQCVVEVAVRGQPAALSHTVGTERVFDSPAHLLTNKRGVDSLALHRGLQRQVATGHHHAVADTTTTTLARGSTTSLNNADSTAVLATLSGVSDPVALSDNEDMGDAILYDGVASADLSTPQPTASALVVQLAQSTDDAVPTLTKRRTSVAAAAVSSAKRSRRGTAAPPPRATATTTATEEEEQEEADEAAAPAVPSPDGTVLFTTGLRLSDQEEETLKALGAVINPHLRFARHAKFLVAQKPLMRSVKLLTVLPFVQEVVQEGWLRTVLHTHTLDIPADGFLYGERRLADSIETLNGFDLRETLRRPPEHRQKLLSGQTFWVHKATAPQDPPINDLKTVLTASGGVVTRRITDANVLVLPQHRPPLKCWTPVLTELGGLANLAQRKQSGVLLVVPDDIFKCVLQQRPLMHSSVPIPRTQLSSLAADGSGEGGSRASRSGGRRPSQAKRKTPRGSTSQRSPRSSTRRRSS